MFSGKGIQQGAEKPPRSVIPRVGGPGRPEESAFFSVLASHKQIPRFARNDTGTTFSAYC